MKRQLLGILVASTFTVPVFAGAYNTPASPTSASTSTSTASGGAGGAGGSATGGAGTGGSANGGTATNTISGTTANGNTSTVSISVTLPGKTTGSGSGETGGTGGTGNGSSSGNSGSSTGSGTSGSTSGTTGTGTGSNGNATTAATDPLTTNAHVDYGGTYTVKSAPAITAPSLTTTLSDTCMGSVSFGLSLTGFGATAASTMVDQACVRRLDSREFRAMGLNDVALALLCQSDANRKAVEATGHDCPGMVRPAVAAANTAPAQALVARNDVSAPMVAAATPVTSVVAGVSEPSAVTASSVSDSDSTDYRDPYVRRRLGLAPLQDETAPN